MQTEQKKDRNIKNKSQKMTDVDSAGHQIGQDSTLAQQQRQNTEITKEAFTKRRADQRNEYNTLIEQHHRQKRTTGNTIESSE